MSALAQQWTEKVAAWSDSGLSIAAWCRQNGAGDHQFFIGVNVWNLGHLKVPAGLSR